MHEFMYVSAEFALLGASTASVSPALPSTVVVLSVNTYIAQLAQRTHGCILGEPPQSAALPLVPVALNCGQRSAFLITLARQRTAWKVGNQPAEPGTTTKTAASAGTCKVGSDGQCY